MEGDRKWLFEHPIELGNALNSQRVRMGSKKPLWRVIDEMTPLERRVVLELPLGAAIAICLSANVQPGESLSTSHKISR